MTQPLIQIPLDLPDVQIEQCEQTPEGLVITVVSTRKTAVCRRCGRSIDKFHGYDQVQNGVQNFPGSWGKER